MRLIFSILLCAVVFSVYGQTPETYTNPNGETHLCGKVSIEDLSTDPLYKDWFEHHYNDFQVEEKKPKWSKKLKKTRVDIFFGTWCEDSQQWVPAFIRLWDELGLNREQLNLIALYDTEEKYKQGPKHEEAGRNIQFIPTFIFTKSEIEIARIVETPTFGLEKDVKLIANIEY